MCCYVVSIEICVHGEKVISLLQKVTKVCPKSQGALLKSGTNEFRKVG